MARRAAVLALVVLGVLASSANATVMVEISLEDMIRDSVGIVHGRVIHSGTQMVIGDGTMDPHTVTTLQVGNWLKGESSTNTIMIRELGGTYGRNGRGGGMWIDGTPQYRVGEEVIVFLDYDPQDPDYFRTLQLAQGKFVVIHGVGGTPAAVARDMAAIAFAEWTDGRMTISHGGREMMELQSFLDLIQNVAQIPGGTTHTVGGGR